ncbi:MAG: hypothetical protein R3F41_04785 [Gammaproteobacteria bacterium]|nr:hypothetical protein [Pseudomonadales bacterium]MCP5345388.1 hypothetical protein [Pseudomonadales bacterium]
MSASQIRLPGFEELSRQVPTALDAEETRARAYLDQEAVLLLARLYGSGDVRFDSFSLEHLASSGRVELLQVAESRDWILHSLRASDAVDRLQLDWGYERAERLIPA